MSHLRTLRQDERGSALMAVLGLMLVTAVIAITIGAATINGLAFTSMSRASVQARAAADAGVDVAIRDLRTTNGCVTDASGNFSSAASAVPSYKVLLERFNPTLGWVAGCPDADSTSVRITSTGDAQTLGVAGAHSGDSATIEAVFDYVPIIVQVPLNGVAVYTYAVDGVLKKFVLSSADNSVATSVMVKTGDVECSNNASIGGDLILGDGSAILDMCDVAGSIHVSKNVTMNKSDVGGDVSASGLVTQTNSVIGGVITSGPTVSAPDVPNWVDVGFNAQHWTDRGYTIVEWAGDCDIKKDDAAWEDMTTYIQPTVINFLNTCATVPVKTLNALDSVELNTDLVFFANEFTFDKLKFASADVHELAFIVPDPVADGSPTCAPPAGTNGQIKLTNETDFGPNVAAMVYTPCKVLSDRNGFRGQIYGGEVEFAQQAQLTFVPVGVPGFDLSDGVTVPKITGAQLGDLTSRRQLAGGD